MTLFATDLELKLSEAIDKNPRSIRRYTARLIAELLLERQLTPEESKRLNSKVCNSFPRNYQGPGYLLTSKDETPKDSMGFLEVLKILERADLMEAQP